ncbi:hypothetical protein M9458_051584, partial [Cirrhinus mrigala]
KDLQHLLQGHICVFQILGPFGAPGDQHSILQCFTFKAVETDSFPSLYCHQRKQWKKSPPPDCSLNRSE